MELLFCFQKQTIVEKKNQNTISRNIHEKVETNMRECVRVKNVKNLLQMNFLFIF